MIQCVHLKQVVAVQETEPYLNKMTLFFQGERQSQTKPAHLQYMSEHLNLCVLIYACVSSFLYIGVCVCACVFSIGFCICSSCTPAPLSPLNTLRSYRPYAGQAGWFPFRLWMVITASRLSVRLNQYVPAWRLMVQQRGPSPWGEEGQFK